MLVLVLVLALVLVLGLSLDLVFQDEDLLNYVAVGDIHPNALGKIRDRKEDLKRIGVNREYKKGYKENT